MLEETIEERVDALTRRVEELSTEVKEIKKEREEEATLIPGAEYDFAPSVPDKIIAKGVAKFGGFVEGPKGLGLSDREWEQFSDCEEDHG